MPVSRRPGISRAPLIGYYTGTGKLKTVDGMADIGEVTRAIREVLA